MRNVPNIQVSSFAEGNVLAPPSQCPNVPVASPIEYSDNSGSDLASGEDQGDTIKKPNSLVDPSSEHVVTEGDEGEAADKQASGDSNSSDEATSDRRRKRKKNPAGEPLKRVLAKRRPRPTFERRA